MLCFELDTLENEAHNMSFGLMDPLGNYVVVSVIFGLTSIIILMLCMGRKKQYVKNDDLEVEPKSRTSSNNGVVVYEKENEKRSSQHSLPLENRTLPGIPKTNGNGVQNAASSTPDLSGTPGTVSRDSTHRNSGSSPKRSTTRRLPALPPAEVDNVQAVDVADNDKEVDDTYEDVRDDRNAPSSAQTETIGSGDSALYAKVAENLQKQADEESDLYAQVGAANENDDQPGTSGAAGDVNDRKPSSSSEDDQNMDSQVAVTYASVDKMKKTMSVKRKVENSASSNTPVAAPVAAPPVPDRNFEDDEETGESVQEPVESLPAPPELVMQEPGLEILPPQNVSQVDHPSNEDERTGPAYDTVSVRESFAHQRLRQMVEDEQRNRYVNTSRSDDGPDLYSQIDEESAEAVYESVSVPGSADGTVGVTGQNAQAAASDVQRMNREDGYSTIGITHSAGNSNTSAPPPLPPNINSSQGASNSTDSPDHLPSDPNYENIHIE